MQTPRGRRTRPPQLPQGAQTWHPQDRPMQAAVPSAHLGSLCQASPRPVSPLAWPPLASLLVWLRRTSLLAWPPLASSLAWPRFTSPHRATTSLATPGRLSRGTSGFLIRRGERWYAQTMESKTHVARPALPRSSVLLPAWVVVCSCIHTRVWRCQAKSSKVKPSTLAGVCSQSKKKFNQMFLRSQSAIYRLSSSKLSTNTYLPQRDSVACR